MRVKRTRSTQKDVEHIENEYELRKEHISKCDHRPPGDNKQFTVLVLVIYTILVALKVKPQDVVKKPIFLPLFDRTNEVALEIPWRKL